MTGGASAPRDTSSGIPDRRGEIDPLRDTSTGPASGVGSGSTVALLTRAQLGRHEGFDRLVFEFRGDLPGHRVEYTSPPVREDGSGRRLRVAGKALVQVRMEPASAYDLEAGVPTFRPGRLDGARAGTSVVLEVVKSGDFESILTWVVGLRKRVDFHVGTLGEPARVIIDFQRSPRWATL